MHKLKWRIKWIWFLLNKIWKSRPITMKTHLDAIFAYNDEIRRLEKEYEAKVDNVTDRVQNLLQNYVMTDFDFGSKGIYGMTIGLDSRLFSNQAMDNIENKKIIAKELSRRVYRDIMQSKFIR